MNILEIKKYLLKLKKEYQISRSFDLLFFFVELCERNFKNQQIIESKFETSLPFGKRDITARFTHSLHLINKHEIKYRGMLRIINMLKIVNFPYNLLQEIFEALANEWKILPDTLLTVEWNINKEKFEKFTIYMLCYKMFNKKISKVLSKKLRIHQSIIENLAKKVDSIALDLFENKDVSLKIYNRVKSTELNKNESSYLYYFNSANIRKILRVNRLFSREKLILQNHRTHFIFKNNGLNFYDFKFKDKLNAPKEIINFLSKRKINVISIDENGDLFEAYFH